jgi:hypothetical protein
MSFDDLLGDPWVQEDPWSCQDIDLDMRRSSMRVSANLDQSSKCTIESEPGNKTHHGKKIQWIELKDIIRI